MFTRKKIGNSNHDKAGKFAKSDYKITLRRKRLNTLLIMEVAVLTTLFIWLCDLTAEKVFEAIYLPIKPVEAQFEPNLSLQEYVFEEVRSELGLEEAIKAVEIISCESQWREDICIIEPNDTISCGLWMINTVHNKKDSANYISNADKLDYKKATEWAINKRISDGNWNAWTCAK